MSKKLDLLAWKGRADHHHQRLSIFWVVPGTADPVLVWSRRLWAKTGVRQNQQIQQFGSGLSSIFGFVPTYWNMTSLRNCQLPTKTNLLRVYSWVIQLSASPADTVSGQRGVAYSSGDSGALIILGQRLSVGLEWRDCKVTLELGKDRQQGCRGTRGEA